MMRRILLACLLLMPVTVFAACPDPIPVNTLCLGWTAPVQNVGGTPLTDLAGFEVFWGMTSGDFNQTRKIDIPDATQTEFTTPATPINIPNPGAEGGDVTVFFVMTAYDEGVLRGPTINCIGDPTDDANDPDNAVDCREISVFSNEIAKVVNFPDQPPSAPVILNVIINVTT